MTAICATENYRLPEGGVPPSGLGTNNARTAAGAEFGILLQIERQLHVARLLMKLCIQSSGTMGKVNKIDVAEHSKQSGASAGRKGRRRQQMNLMTKWK